MIRDKAPVSITLIKPSAIGTPFPQHGRNLTGARGRLPLPIYSPELVADAICFAAQHPRRAITIGGAGRVQVMGATLVPSVFDRVAAAMGPMLLDKDKPVPFIEGNLYEPAGDGPHAEGRQKGRRFSLYTARKTNPGLGVAAMALGGVALGAWVARKPARVAGALALAGLTASALQERAKPIGRFGRDLKEGLTDPHVFAEHAKRRVSQLSLH